MNDAVCRRSWRRARPVVLFTLLVVAVGCGASSQTLPIVPTTGGLTIGCPKSVYVGQTLPCIATDSLGVLVMATWSSSDSSIASFGNIGSLTGRAAGQVRVTATYLGQTADADVTVVAQDIVEADASATGGVFAVGNMVSMTLIGFYGVASADSGTLRLVITDQSGAVVTATPAQAVARGGNEFVLTASFTIAPGTTQVCRAAVLQIGSTVLTSSVPIALFPCVSVAQ